MSFNTALNTAFAAGIILNPAARPPAPGGLTGTSPDSRDRRVSRDSFFRDSLARTSVGMESSKDECMTPTPGSLHVPSALRLYSGNLENVDVDELVGGMRSSRRSSANGESLPGSGLITPTSTFARSSLKDMQVSDNWALASTYLKSSWQFQVTGRAAAAAVLSDFKTERVARGGPVGIEAYALDKVREGELEDTFYVYDLGNVTRMFKAWRTAMPRVTPYYAVKCNPEPGILKLLLALGAGFDCASKAELRAILSLGVPQSRIIFAHPCKRPSDIAYAAENHVEFTTFDTESELHKIAAGNPRFKCVLRIRADDPEARVPLGLKYGANPEDAPKLLAVAMELGLQVVGVSFHVGSACKNLGIFREAIATARHIFDIAELMGFHMEVLDIGGGFTGHFAEDGSVIFGEIASTINEALEKEFPPETGVRVMAEPGRYFAETSATLFTPIYGTRDRVDPTTVDAPGGASPGSSSGGAAAASSSSSSAAHAPAPSSTEPVAVRGIKKDYWITDGLYGSFNCILYDGQNPEYRVVRSPLLPEVGDVSTYKSTIWGPTCDSADCVYKDVMLPELRTGDWLMFPNAGAYTVAGACDFNGINMTQPIKYYVFSTVATDTAELPVDALALAQAPGLMGPGAGGDGLGLEVIEEAGEAKAL